MTEKVEFTLLEKISSRGLAEEVNQYLKKGWRLHGGINVATSHKQTAQAGGTEKYVSLYSQAMVKDVETVKEVLELYPRKTHQQS
ncbi:DUF1737 domain-containing protein [Thiomicrorhabdus aquaedulcis]|uniref:DUF1737 domain-containing protein n=1 Tax=Thiomicrorhabdus aquaedulcis TaxID=2211106 RepID=UPI000FDB7E67|nr:DUF1737 domain-containing protein [Thiomicrorhabdus aquaedulcis]